jgi:adenylate kinase
MSVDRKQVDTSAIKGIPIIWLMGGPGSGKGTQCDKICIKYGFTHLSSGDILRNEVMSGTPRGRQLYQLMSNGEPVPNEVVDDLLAESMVKKAESKGFLIDGYPMDTDQAESFTKNIAAPNMVILLECNDEILKERLKGRNNFDDTQDAILKRIETYNSKTKPVAQKHNAKVINASGASDAVFAELEKIVATLL